MEPGVLEEFINTGAIEGMLVTPELLLVFAIVFLVPLVMAVLSLTLKGSANRWANIILGIVYAGLDLIDLVEAVAKQSPYAILMMISVVVAPALIVWYAWKSKQEA